VDAADQPITLPASILEAIERCAEAAPNAPVTTLSRPSPRDWLAQHGYDDHEPRNVEILVRYLEGRQRGEIKRGLTLVGNTGVGKTFGLRLALAWLVHPGKPRLVTAQEIGELYGNDHPGQALAIGRGARTGGWQTELIIDDVGDEPETGFSGGVRRTIMADIIKARYDLWSRTGTITHFTSNRSPAALCGTKGRYDARTLSRMEAMAYTVVMRGADRRLQYRETDPFDHWARAAQDNANPRLPYADSDI